MSSRIFTLWCWRRGDPEFEELTRDLLYCLTRDFILGCGWHHFDPNPLRKKRECSAIVTSRRRGNLITFKLLFSYLTSIRFGPVGGFLQKKVIPHFVCQGVGKGGNRECHAICVVNQLRIISIQNAWENPRFWVHKLTLGIAFNCFFII